MSESQITEGVVVRIEHELGLLVEEMAELCVPARRGPTELRLRRSLIFGKLGDKVIWIDIYEKVDRLGRLFRLEVRDMTFEPGHVYTVQKIFAPLQLRGRLGDLVPVQLFLSEMGKALVRGIRKDLGPDPRVQTTTFTAVAKAPDIPGSNESIEFKSRKPVGPISLEDVRRDGRRQGSADVITWLQQRGCLNSLSPEDIKAMEKDVGPFT